MLNEKEIERVKDLYDYQVLDTPSEKSIHSITKLTQIICETPICFVSLLDETRIYFKSRQGMEYKSTTKEISFCQYAINQDEIFEVEDALEVERFKNNQLVTGPPFIRYYCGMSLRTPNGNNIGTLCVIDTKPKKMNNHQKIALKTLSEQVIIQFEMKKLIKQLQATNQMNKELSEAKDNFLSTVSHELRTPLNAINGFTDILKGLIEDETQIDFLDIIKSNAKSLIMLVNEILDSSKLESGKLAIVKESFPLEKLMKEIFLLFSESIGSKGVKYYVIIQ